MEFSQTIGIDVSKDYLDFALYQNNQRAYLARVSNQVVDLQSFMESLQKTYSFENTLFCLETTGIYTQPFLLVGMQVQARIWLQSALEISQSLGVKRSKNDVLDAQEIAEYAFRQQDKAQLYQAPGVILTKIQALLSLRARLLESSKRLKVPLQEAQLFSSPSIATLLDKCSEHTLEGIKDDLKQIEQELLALLDLDERLKKNFELIQSVVGVGKWTSFEVLLTTQNFMKFKQAEQYASYCGVVPFAKDSGKKKGRRKVSFFANKAMKAQLHMCALSAIRHDAELQAYYERKIKEGKPKLLVLNAVRNKIILRIFAVIRKQQKYEKKVLQNLDCS
ncbi:MAG: IS110 family transposase [Thermonemataceae bacterium]|nr:IS110 family transposase [Thermonemataceae bacterium]